MSRLRELVYIPLTTEQYVTYPVPLSRNHFRGRSGADTNKAIKTEHTRAHFSFGEEFEDGEGKKYSQSTYTSDFKPITLQQCNKHLTVGGEMNAKAPSYFSIGYDTGNYLETEAQRSQNIVVNNSKGMKFI